MSTKKDKILESAQRFILKGQIDRAIKDYEQVVTIDPKETRHRQRLAELLVRAGRKEDAAAEYDAIGRFYADNGYFLKAIAVYKQIQRLDPGNIKVTLTLASLNAKQGLVGNALAEYGAAVDYYEKNGQLSDALAVIEQMLAIDAENPATCRKYAEMLYVVGEHEKAFQTFTQLSLSLNKEGNEYAFEQVNARMGALFPERQEPSVEMLAEQLEKGCVDNAIPKLSGLIKKDSRNLAAWKLLVEAYRLKGDGERLKLTFSLIIRLFPDELFARAGVVLCALDEGKYDEAVGLAALHAPYFEASGAYIPLETLYSRCLEISPDDGRIKEGLKRLFEKSGDNEKLAALQNDAANLHAETEPLDCEIPLTLDDSVVDGQTAEFLGAETPSHHKTEWEEEIYLDIDDDEVERSIEVPAESEPSDAMDAAPFVPEPEPELQIEQNLPDDEPAPAVDNDETGDELAFDTYQPIEFDFEEVPMVPSDDGDGPAGDTDVSLAVEPQAIVDPEPETFSWEAEPDETLNEAEPESSEAGAPGEDAGEVAHGLSLDISEEMDEFLDQFDELLTPPLEAESADSAKLDKYSWDGMFSEFKKGIDAQVDVGDTETHYDLGIAYKEMGLYDDAIKEFRNASVDPQRRVDCLTLQAVCYREKCEFDMAEELLLSGIGLEGLTDAESLGLKYELAFLFENSGRMDDALRVYCEVSEINPDFHGVAGKIASLKGVAETQEIIDLYLEDVEVLDEDGSGGEEV